LRTEACFLMTDRLKAGTTNHGLLNVKIS
jgi:hypothetical protein